MGRLRPNQFVKWWRVASGEERGLGNTIPIPTVFTIARSWVWLTQLRTVHSMIHRNRKRDWTNNQTNDCERFFLANWPTQTQSRKLIITRPHRQIYFKPKTILHWTGLPQKNTVAALFTGIIKTSTLKMPLWTLQPFGPSFRRKKLHVFNC